MLRFCLSLVVSHQLRFLFYSQDERQAIFWESCTRIGYSTTWTFKHSENWSTNWMWHLLCAISPYWWAYIRKINVLIFLWIWHWLGDVNIDDELGDKSGSGTDCTCENNSCSRAFHSVCLGDWLRSITTTRQ